jgi:hypothetical protein
MAEESQGFSVFGHYARLLEGIADDEPGRPLTFANLLRMNWDHRPHCDCFQRWLPAAMKFGVDQVR